MKSVEFFTTGDYSYEILESEFASEKSFDDFVEWTVDMIKTIHAESSAITKVVVTETPVLQTYDV